MGSALSKGCVARPSKQEENRTSIVNWQNIDESTFSQDDLSQHLNPVNKKEHKIKRKLTMVNSEINTIKNKKNRTEKDKKQMKKLIKVKKTLLNKSDGS